MHEIRFYKGIKPCWLIEKRGNKAIIEYADTHERVITLIRLCHKKLKEAGK